MAWPTRWTWVWVDSGSWWWTRRPGRAAIHGVAKSRTQLSDWTKKMTHMVSVWSTDVYQLKKMLDQMVSRHVCLELGVTFTPASSCPDFCYSLSLNHEGYYWSDFNDLKESKGVGSLSAASCSVESVWADPSLRMLVQNETDVLGISEFRLMLSRML